MTIRNRLERVPLAGWVLLAASLVTFPAVSADLPAYYEFFMKQGGQEAIAAEIERNDHIESGSWEPIHVGRLIEDFKLPDGFGHTVGLRDYVGRKNVVLTTFRTWW